jgi:uncharacterized membrane protein/thiol-disulfide isomerase/thioredoxin
MRYTKSYATKIWLVLFILGIALLLVLPTAAFAQDGEQVTIYLFWGDGCPHCEVAKPALRALADRYPNVEVMELEIWYLAANQAILTQMASALDFTPRYVPTIIIGERYWEGYSDILLVEMEATVEACLDMGCPDLGSGIVPEAAQPGAVANAAAPGAAQMQSNGFTLAVVVMVGMVAALVYGGLYLRRGLQRLQNPKRTARRKQKAAQSVSLERWRTPAILALCLVGLGVAAYLAYVETQAVQAVCGPVGDCNAVQSSPYARLFGVLPIGVLGLAGYLLILAAWVVTRLKRNQLATYMPIVVFGLAFFGVLFSLYLTYLEPFVIRAVCMWCISSAVIMTLLMLLRLRPALLAIIALKESNRSHAKIEAETTPS